MKIHNYEADKFGLYEEIKKVFLTDLELSNLHEEYKFDHFNMSNNSDTILHDRFYQSLRSGQNILKVYNQIIEQVVYPIIGQDFVFQKMPTLRVHLVDNWATPEFHVDTQEGYNHPHGEENFILPLTDCYDTNAVWVESSPMKGDYAPVEMKYGNLFQFSGGKLRHGNKINNTKTTRVSIDFRVLPMSKYDENYPKTSATTGRSFTVGSYYTKRGNQ